MDAEAQKEMTHYKMQGVPAFLIGEDVIVGFDKERLLGYLDFKIFTCHHCKTKARVPKDKGLILLTCSKCHKKYKIKT